MLYALGLGFLAHNSQALVHLGDPCIKVLGQFLGPSERQKVALVLEDFEFRLGHDALVLLCGGHGNEGIVPTMDDAHGKLQADQDVSQAALVGFRKVATKSHQGCHPIPPTKVGQCPACALTGVEQEQVQSMVQGV